MSGLYHSYTTNFNVKRNTRG